MRKYGRVQTEGAEAITITCNTNQHQYCQNNVSKLYSGVSNEKNYIQNNHNLSIETNIRHQNPYSKQLNSNNFQSQKLKKPIHQFSANNCLPANSHNSQT